MTMRTSFAVKCSCGHVGAIRMSENDQPYSKSYENYSLVNLDGGGDYNVTHSANLDEVFDALKPLCPECKKPLSSVDLTNTRQRR